MSSVKSAVAIVLLIASLALTGCGTTSSNDHPQDQFAKAMTAASSCIEKFANQTGVQPAPAPATCVHDNADTIRLVANTLRLVGAVLRPFPGYVGAAGSALTICSVVLSAGAVGLDIFESVSESLSPDPAYAQPVTLRTSDATPDSSTLTTDEAKALTKLTANVQSQLAELRALRTALSRAMGAAHDGASHDRDARLRQASEFARRAASGLDAEAGLYTELRAALGNDRRIQGRRPSQTQLVEAKDSIAANTDSTEVESDFERLGVDPASQEHIRQQVATTDSRKAEWTSSQLIQASTPPTMATPVSTTTPSLSPSSPSVARDRCRPGFVWRLANAKDHVCVTPATRDQTSVDNAAVDRRNPDGGPFGPDTCRQGFVWRDAFIGDHVCVLPATRDQAASDNRLAPQRVEDGSPPA